MGLSLCMSANVYVLVHMFVSVCACVCVGVCRNVCVPEAVYLLQVGYKIDLRKEESSSQM